MQGQSRSSLIKVGVTGRWSAYRRAIVRERLSTTKKRARVGLTFAPCRSEIWRDRAGHDVERAGGGVVLSAHEAGEGRRGDEKGRVEHGDGCPMELRVNG